MLFLINKFRQYKNCVKRITSRLKKLQKKIRNESHLNSIEKKILIYLIVLQILIYFVISLYWNQIQNQVISVSLIVLGVVIINLLQLFYVFKYFHTRREQKFFENFGYYHLHLEPILSIIQKKEIKLYQMTVDFKNSLPMSQDEMETRAQKIINDCFIQLDFTSDALLNALFFKYYNLFQSSRVEMKTLVSKEFKLEKVYQLKLYEAVEFCFEMMVWLIRQDVQPSLNLTNDQTKRIVFLLSQNRDGLQFNCSYESEFSELLSIATYFEREKRKKYTLNYFARNLRLELSPTRICIKFAVKYRKSAIGTK